jgi:polar amino acid transport system substrate-binding protein
MIADFPICVVSVFRYPDENLLSVVTPLTYEPLGIAVPRGDAHLVNWLENLLESLDGSGTIDALNVRWFEDANWMLELP